MATIKSFPPVIHVKVIEDGENDYLTAHVGGFPDALGEDDNAIIAMYSLMSVKKVFKAFPQVRDTKSKKTK